MQTVAFTSDRILSHATMAPPFSSSTAQPETPARDLRPLNYNLRDKHSRTFLRQHIQLSRQLIRAAVVCFFLFHIMQSTKQQFIEFALDADVLRFGEFKTKAGRLSPYFFNAGLFNTGALLDKLGAFYAETLLAARKEGRIEFDMIFGPAYKGIPLAASVAMNLARLGCDVPWAFNRKEAKDHGEGGMIVGAPLKGRVVIIDDVISAGTSVRESVKIIEAAGATPSGVLIAVDRQERGGNAEVMTESSAVQDVEKTFGLHVASIINLHDLLAFLDGPSEKAKAVAGYRNAVAQYRQRYGA